ncbi:hypothetical protein [Acidianus sulfidivorans]|uniref:hypothetical protein n=1 Tax=Acidianus sulfidivorans TaxID=312539 RepID=UPI001F0EF9A2|nr:hypothetical protein [Acidianus sulfidivorans]
MMKIKVGILGAYTIDDIYENNARFQRPGGSPIYSSLGVYLAGGLPYVFTIKGRDFTFSSPEYIYSEYVDKTDANLRFEIDLKENSRRILKLKTKSRKININYSNINSLNGIIINPVCKEVDEQDIKNIHIPIAIDIQGFIRNCIEGEEIRYERASLPYNSNYFVLHANYEEKENSGLTIDDMFKLGFKEIIISYGNDGFILYTANNVYKMNNTIKGNFEIGNGDFLLGFYFTLRLQGIDISKAVEITYDMATKFAIYGPNLLTLLK